MRARFPHTRKNASGYALDAWLASGDLLDLVIGAEGTLGFVTAAEWRLDPLPGARAGLRVALRTLDVLADAVAALLAHEPSAVELLDRTFLELVGEAGPRGGAAGRDRARRRARRAEAVDRAAAAWRRGPRAWTPGSPPRRRAALGAAPRGEPDPRGPAGDPPLAPGDRGRLRARRADGRVRPRGARGRRGASARGRDLRPCGRRSRPREPAARAGPRGLGGGRRLTARGRDRRARPPGRHAVGRARRRPPPRGPSVADLRRRGRRAVRAGQARVRPTRHPQSRRYPSGPAGGPPIGRLKAGARAAALPDDIARGLRRIEQRGGYAQSRLELADGVPPQP